MPPELDVGSEASVAGGCSPDPSWTLCVRGTFLNPVAPAVLVNRRSSDPGVHYERPSFFAEEEGYAKELSDRMSRFGVPSALEEPTTPSASAPTPLSARSSCASGSTEPWPRAGPASPPGHGVPSSECIGHPALCRLPCSNAALCLASCGRKKAQHLDKRHRQVFGLMNRREQVEALRCTMAAKVEELGLGATAAQALEEWRREVAAASPLQERSVVSPVDARRLQRHLDNLYLNDLCFLPAPNDVRAASMRLLERLRALRAGA